MRLRIISAAFLVFFSLTSYSYSKELKPTFGLLFNAGKTNVLRVSFTEEKIKIDGRLNEAAWKKALKIDLPNEFFPGYNIPAPVKTICLITYNRNYLYIAFIAYDPEPHKIRAHLMDRDAVQTFILDDHVYFTIDTFNDERRAFEFRVNPLGVQVDGLLSETEGYEDFSWDAIWDSKGKITVEGYIVEIAIPFNQLRFPKSRKTQTWGFFAFRSYPRNVRYRFSSLPIDRNKSCVLCQEGKITGFQGISPGLNLEFDPTLTFSRTDERTGFPEGPMEAGKVKTKPGITGRWGITPNLILNGTVNPDFSQVEADAAQLDVNVRFALYYPEKRPFFLEGADFFLTPLKIVFTRTVADPLWGMKLTGKVDKNALGVFVAQDRINNLIFPSNQGSESTSLDENLYGGVFRYRRDIGKGSTIGVIYTGRMSDDYYNHVAGFDGFFRLSKSKVLRLQYMFSQTDYPDDIAEKFGQKKEAFKGSAVYAQFHHDSKNWFYELKYERLSPDFRADYGFIPRVDYEKFLGNFQRKIWGKRKKWLSFLDFGIKAYRITDHEYRLTDSSIDLYIDYLGPLQLESSLDLMKNKEFYNGFTYDEDILQWFFSLKPLSGTQFYGGTIFGDAVDYTGFRAAKRLLLTSGAQFNVGKHFSVNLRNDFERLYIKEGEIYKANIAQAKFIYNFNIRTFIRAIVQYRYIDRNPPLYPMPVEDKVKTFFTQFLFSYKINPQTVLFIGYSDNYLGFSAFKTNVDMTQKNRTFFMKMGYAWTR